MLLNWLLNKSKKKINQETAAASQVLALLDDCTMIWIAFVLCLTPVVQIASSNVEWCYHDPSCNSSTWPRLTPDFCAGSRQSPIDIVSKKAIFDSSLTPFTFTKFNSKTALTKIENTGSTVIVTFGSGVGVSGGGLSEPYSSLSFHLHWGNGASVPGSEHTVDGRRYPMEFHIVSIKSSYNGNITAALADSEGIAEHGFFIEASNDTTGKPESWKTLTSYLSKITEKGQSVAISDEISLDDLLPNVNRKRFYRYLGSLEIPNCHEAVVWTVFKEPVKVCKDLIDLFSKTVRIGNGTSAYITNNHRITQPELPVTYS